MIAAAACGGSGPDSAGDSASGDAPITLEEAAAATFEHIYDEPIRLQDGRWEGEPFVDAGAARPSVDLVDLNRWSGDLDGDGREEAVVLLAESSGGSGTFLYLAVVGRKDGELVNLGTSAIGDRVQVRDVHVEGPRVELDVIQAGPGDAACCPTQKATRTFELWPDGLVEGATQVTGVRSLADLADAEWVLTHIARAQRSPWPTTTVGSPARAAAIAISAESKSPSPGASPSVSSAPL